MLNPQVSPAKEAYLNSLELFHRLLDNKRPLKGDYEGYAFDGLSAEVQGPISASLVEWVKFCQMQAFGGGISDKQFLWRFLSVFRFKTHPDFFSSVDDSTSFEVVNCEGMQTYRSISLMDFCSYSLDELVSIPWFELFKRDQSITDCYMQFQGAVVNGTLEHTDLRGIIPVHEVSERYSVDKMVLTIEPLYLSPIYDLNGKMAGVISALKVLSSRSSRQPKFMW